MTKEEAEMMGIRYIRDVEILLGESLDFDFKKAIKSAYITGLYHGMTLSIDPDEAAEIKKSLDFEKSYKQWKGHEMGRSIVKGLIDWSFFGLAGLILIFFSPILVYCVISNLLATE